jgi:hypothetical protein
LRSIATSSEFPAPKSRRPPHEDQVRNSELAELQDEVRRLRLQARKSDLYKLLGLARSPFPSPFFHSGHARLD